LSPLNIRSILILIILLPLLVNCGGGGSGGGGLPGNTAPVADAGADQAVGPGGTVVLDGSGSTDPDGDALSYAWSFVSKPAGSNAALNDNTLVGPAFAADRGGRYVLQLVVNDGTIDSRPDTVEIVSRARGMLDANDFAAPDGFVVLDTAGGDDDFGFASAVDPAGNLYVAGYSVTLNGDADLAVWKFTDTGAPDTTFGVGGVFLYDRGAVPAVGFADDIGSAIAVDAAGLIYVAGSSVNDNGDADMALWRVLPDGSGLDPGFAGGVIFDHGAAGGNGNDFGQGLALDGAGRIYVAGSSVNASGDGDMVIWAYRTTDGLPESGFSGDGIFLHANAAGGNAADAGFAIAVDGGGNLLVAGYSDSAANRAETVIWKITGSGNLDAAFGAAGIVVKGNAAGGDGDDFGNSIAVSAAGNIYVAGESTNTLALKDMVVWALDPAGGELAAFGTNGVAVFEDPSGALTDTVGAALVLDPLGNLLISGYGDNGTDKDMVLWRYTDTGQLDTGFATNGLVSHDDAAGGLGDDLGRALSLNPDGRITVIGDSLNSNSDSDVAAWRFR